MLAALEFAAIVATAFFGIFGSLVDFRDSRGNISLKGWIALVGVIIASSTVGTLPIYSKFQEEEHALALLDKNTMISSDINRSLNPLQGLTTRILLSADWSMGRLNNYFSALERAFDHERSFGGSSLPRASCEDSKMASQPETSVNQLASPLPVPSAPFAAVPCETGQIIHDVFCPLDVILFFYKDPSAADDFEYRGVGENHAEDLRIGLRNPCSFASLNEQLSRHGINIAPTDSDAMLEYDLREGKLHRLDLQIRHESEATFEDWRGNSKIISLHDLLGALLIIQLSSGRVVSEEIKALMETVTIRQIVLKLPHGIMLSFDESNLIHHNEEYTYAFYSILFPDKLEDLLALTSYDPFVFLD